MVNLTHTPHTRIFYDPIPVRRLADVLRHLLYCRLNHDRHRYGIAEKNGAHKVSIKEALAWSGIWVAVSCAFAGWLYFELAGNPTYGAVIAKEKILEFFTGYVLEKSLAVDNIFVFLMIFGYFKVEPKFQHRVLLYGVFGAIVLRAIMIFIGAALVQQFEWILYLFGAFLLYTGIHMMKPEAEAEEDLSQNKILTLLKKVIPTSQQFDGENSLPSRTANASLHRFCWY